MHGYHWMLSRDSQEGLLSLDKKVTQNREYLWLLSIHHLLPKVFWWVFVFFVLFSLCCCVTIGKSFLYEEESASLLVEAGVSSS